MYDLCRRGIAEWTVSDARGERISRGLTARTAVHYDYYYSWINGTLCLIIVRVAGDRNAGGVPCGIHMFLHLHDLHVCACVRPCAAWNMWRHVPEFLVSAHIACVNTCLNACPDTRACQVLDRACFVAEDPNIAEVFFAFLFACVGPMLLFVCHCAGDKERKVCRMHSPVKSCSSAQL